MTKTINRIRLIIKNQLKEALYEMSFNLPSYNHKAQERLRYINWLTTRYTNLQEEVVEEGIYQMFKEKDKK